MERQGVVRVREEVQVELPWHRYTASWQPSPDGPAMSFYSEGGPGWNEIEDAITWARSHAPIVYVRLGQGLSEIYNAGERDGDAQRPTERWPGAPPARAREVHPDYGGVVYVDEEHLVFVPTGRFSAVWGSASGELLEDAEDLFEDLEAAVDWGRRRAAVVLVAELPLSWSHVPTYEIRSAGEEDPPGDPLERLRPRPGQATMEWSFTTQETVSETEPDAYSRELEDALRRDNTVSDPVCRVLEEQSGFRVLACARRRRRCRGHPHGRATTDPGLGRRQLQRLGTHAQACLRARNRGAEPCARHWRGDGLQPHRRLHPPRDSVEPDVR